mgnify:CR=1 FL=1
MAMIESVKNFFRKNSSKILAVISCGGVVVTGYFAGKGTYDAIKALKRKNKPEDSKKKKLKTVLPYYIPAIGFGISTIASILGLTMLDSKKQKALTSAYMLLSNSYQEYRKKIKDIHGKNADLAAISSIASENLPEGEILENKELFYDAYSQRYFTSTMLDVTSAIYHYNRNFQLRGYAALNEFYEFLEIDTIECGDYFGFNATQMLEDGFLGPWIDISLQRAKDCNGRDFHIIVFDWFPIPNYENYGYEDWNGNEPINEVIEGRESQ